GGSFRSSEAVQFFAKGGRYSELIARIPSVGGWSIRIDPSHFWDYMAYRSTRYSRQFLGNSTVSLRPVPCPSGRGQPSPDSILPGWIDPYASDGSLDGLGDSPALLDQLFEDPRCDRLGAVADGMLGVLVDLDHEGVGPGGDGSPAHRHDEPRLA